MDLKALKAFKLLKKQFKSAPLLIHFRPKMLIRIKTDTSKFTISGILSQQAPGLDRKLQWHPVAFFLKKLIAAEHNYNIYNTKLLAIVASFKY